MVSIPEVPILIKVPSASLYGATAVYLITYNTTQYERIPLTNSQADSQTK